MMDVIIGTAGHIDHGKTALVRALTGTDTDRLPEEKMRGITIDLGFAELDLGDVHFGIVDVPGHERFVKNMLAGASGIDIMMLVIAADEGIMPQTREHFDICRLLDIKSGLIAVTKRDIVDDEMLSLVRTEIAEYVAGSFLEGAAMVAVSSRTGEGIEELRSALLSVSSRSRAVADDRVVRLPIDRSFAMKGFGTVVTGTLSSGTIHNGNELELLPENRILRVRGVQAHGRTVSEAHSGRRTAVNLAGIDHREIKRGMLLAEPNVLKAGQMFDAFLDALCDSPRPLKSGQRVRVHIGTGELLARIEVIDTGQRIEPGKSGFVQLRLESPSVAVTGERFIIRSYSPQMTIAGGTVLRRTDEKFRRKDEKSYIEFLSQLNSSLTKRSELLRAFVNDAADRGIALGEIRSLTGWTAAALEDAKNSSDEVLEYDGTFISKASFAAVEALALESAERFHSTDRLAKSVSLEILRAEAFKFVRPEIERAVLNSLTTKGKLSLKGDEIMLAGREVQLSDSESKAIASIRNKFSAAGLEVPKLETLLAETAASTGVSPDVIRKLFHQLLDAGEFVRINSEFCVSSKVVDDLIMKVRDSAGRSADRLVDVSKFKDIAGVSRKYAIPLLEYFDQRKVTVRRGDKRFVL